jgi:ABC-type bacteriocin/lantibiotic exporter with double-glycine peptidase domain
MTTPPDILVRALELLGWRRDPALLGAVLGDAPGPSSLNDWADRLSWLGLAVDVAPAAPEAWRHGADGALLQLGPDGLGALVRVSGREQALGRGIMPGHSVLLVRRLPDAIAGRAALEVLRRRAFSIGGGIAALSVVINLLALAVPFFTMAIYDRVIGAQGHDSLWPLVAGAVLALLLLAGLRLLRGRAMAAEHARLGASIAALTEQRLLNAPAAAQDRQSTFMLLNRQRGAERAADIFLPANAPALFDAPLIVLTLLAILAVAGWLVVIPALYLGLFLLAGWWLGRTPPERDPELAQAASERERMTGELTALGRRIARAGAQAAWLDRFDAASRRSAVLSLLQQRRASWLQAVSYTLGTGAALATLVAGIELVLVGAATAGTLIGLMMLVWRITGPAQALFLGWPRLRQIQAGWRQLGEIAAIPGFAADAASQIAPPAAAPALAFSGAYWRHDGMVAPAITGVTAEVPAGSVAILLGANGAGKSTLLRMAAGVLPTQSGAVLLDGRDIRQYDPQALMRALAWLPTPPALAADGRVPDDATAVGLAAWAALEQRDAVLYLLDDPLPFGGAAAREALARFIRERRGKATILIATHDTSLTELADHAIVLDRGAMAYAGPVKRPDAVAKPGATAA